MMQNRYRIRTEIVRKKTTRKQSELAHLCQGHVVP